MAPPKFAPAAPLEVALARHLGLDPATVVAGSFHFSPSMAHAATATTLVKWTEADGNLRVIRERAVPTAELNALAPRGKSPQRYLQDPSGGTVQRPRIPDATWIPALERCHDENRPIGHVLTDLLNLWLAGDIDLGGKP
jgi:hypothetical protein